jgi:putative hydrolase of the HAD superfamily
MRTPILIFDFGNVVAFFDYLRACETMGAHAGLSGPELLAQALERGFTPLLHQFEAGQVDALEFSRSTCAMAGVTLAHDAFVAAWEDIFWINEPVTDLAAGLKRLGYRLFLGSNTNVLHATYYRRKFARELAPFEGFVLSYEVGVEKPARAFYEACAQAAEAAPGDCLFIDDVFENVEGARAAGLRAIQYRDTEALVRDLAAEGVELPPIRDVT